MYISYDAFILLFTAATNYIYPLQHSLLDFYIIYNLDFMHSFLCVNYSDFCFVIQNINLLLEKKNV